MLESSNKRFDQIYDEFHTLVRNVIYNMVDDEALDDLVQEAFLRIWTGLPRFAFRSTIKTWVYRVSINTAIDHLRKSKVRPSLSYPEWNEISSESFGAAAPARNLMIDPEVAIQRALNALDENHRSVVVLHYFEELKLEMISKILDLPVGTVKSRLYHAKAKLKDLLRMEGVFCG